VSVAAASAGSNTRCHTCVVTGPAVASCIGSCSTPLFVTAAGAGSSIWYCALGGWGVDNPVYGMDLGVCLCLWQPLVSQSGLFQGGPLVTCNGTQCHAPAIDVGGGGGGEGGFLIVNRASF
jgi:hypothetical protein